MIEPILAEIDALQKEINAIRPLSADMLKQVREYYRVGLTYASNALEGNSLTESETKVVLEDGLTIGGKPLRDHYEATGHAEAYDLLCDLGSGKNFSEEDIRKIHHLFYRRIDEKNAGVYRTLRAFITGSRYPLPKPEEIESLMSRFVKGAQERTKTQHPVIAAARFHKEFVFIHPFVDGNGRVARLVMNLILLQAGYNIAIIPPVVRAEYIRTLEKAHTDDSDFIDLIARMVRETQKDYLRLFR